MFDVLRGRLPRIGKWPRLLVAATCGLLALESAATAHSTTRARTPGVSVVVAAHDLPAGRVVTRRDAMVARWAAGTVPASALARVDAVVGRRLAVPLARREAITRTRLLGRDLTTGLPPGHVAVAVLLADPHIADLIRPGDAVDLLATAAPDIDSGLGAHASAPTVTVVGRRLIVLAVLPGSTTDGDRGTELVVEAKPDIAVRIARESPSQTLAAVGVPP